MSYEEFKNAIIKKLQAEGIWKVQSKDFNKWLEAQNAESYIQDGYQTLKADNGQYLESTMAATIMNIEWD